MIKSNTIKNIVFFPKCNIFISLPFTLRLKENHKRVDKMFCEAEVGEDCFKTMCSGHGRALALMKS